ncbi:MAG: fumarylacetoacetate hydrolase family protein [Alphaproteobacteria bacterium]|nr:fumarylacetoacetate hydrolase family protein [Alphaproteobacteria bacterium]
MRLVTFSKKGQPTVGVAHHADLIDLSVAAPKLPRDMIGLIAAGRPALAAASKAVDKAKGKAVKRFKAAKLLPPIPRPGKIIMVGLNYRLHAQESGMAIPAYPQLFARWSNTLSAHNEAMVLPKASSMFDWECELAVIVGRKARAVPADKALGHVFGYSLFNDGSIRDYQFKPGPGAQWTAGKNWDKTGAFGPWIVTADELPPGAAPLEISTTVNGQVMQKSHTGDMIFDVATLIALISEFATLEPGDLIVTGTPAGVGHGRKPPVYLKAGDVCTVAVERIGELTSRIVAQK